MRLPIARYTTVRAGHLELAASGGVTVKSEPGLMKGKMGPKCCSVRSKSEDEVNEELKDGSKNQRGKRGLKEGRHTHGSDSNGWMGQKAMRR